VPHKQVFLSRKDHPGSALVITGPPNIDDLSGRAD